MTTKMAKKGAKKAAKKTAKKKVQKPTRPKAPKSQKMQSPVSSEEYGDFDGIHFSINGSALTLTVDSDDEFRAKVTVEVSTRESFFVRCWDGQRWVGC